jgi:hypothetical protein
MESGLSQEQRNDVEITRLGLLLHPYHALQGVMATLPDGPDGKQHLPAGQSVGTAKLLAHLYDTIHA